MRTRAKFAIAAGMVLLLSAVTTYGANPGKECQKVLDAHVGAIKDRNIEKYMETVTAGEDLTIIFPSGDRSTTRAEALTLHQEWFADPNWEMTFRDAHRRVTPSTCLVLLETSYRDSPEGEVHQSWLTLVFAMEDGEWRMVFDQNTRK